MKMSLTSILAGAAALVAPTLVASTGANAETMRLEWVMQGQFAGPIVAYEKGYYKEAGVDLELLPAGPDIKPAVMVATGADTFGIGHPNQIIAARANGAPLITVAQLGQKSVTAYIARKDSGIESIEDMPGHSVGLWFGGDEQEFLAMLAAADIPQSDVNIVSQGYDIVGWLNGDYDVMQVTLYNELQQVYRQGFSKDDLVFLDPADQGVAIISTGIFTTDAEVADDPETVQAVVNATLRGWQEALADPEAAAAIVAKYNDELVVEDQVEQIKAMGELFCAGPTLEGKFGETDPKDWEVAQKILVDAELIDNAIDIAEGYTNKFVDAAPAEYRTLACEG